MEEKNQIRTYKRLLIVVSVVLAGVLCLQGIYWMRHRSQAAGEGAEKAEGQATAAQPDAETARADDAPQAGNRGSLSHEGYTLQQVVVMSRHNIRSPLSGKGSVLDTITPHEWFSWSSDPSELSLRGGNAEAAMGQWFRKWLEAEGFFEKNYRPQGDEVRIYANSKQRTIATARFFAAGLFPAADVPVEYHMEFDKMDPVFTPQVTFLTEEYSKDVVAQAQELFGEKLFALEDNYALLEEVIDAKDSEAAKNGEFTGFAADDAGMKLELNAEPKITGSLRTACSVADALVLQYYEEPDPVKAAFGHTLTFEQWRQISEVKDLCVDFSAGTPLLAYNTIHPLLQEIRGELTKDGRRFTFLCGHDSNIGPILTCLKAQECELADSVETKTPIGGKIVFARWLSPDGEDLMSVDLVYESAQQLRGLSLLSPGNPPYAAHLVLEGLGQNADGLYETEAVLGRFDEAIGEYDKILEKYGAAEDTSEEDSAAEDTSAEDTSVDTEEDTSEENEVLDNAA